MELFLETMLCNLFQVLEVPGSQENEYVMKGMSAVKYNTGNIINVRQVYPTIGLPIPKFKIMETGDEFLNCQSQERSQNMLKLVSLPSLNHVEGFQKLEKLAPL